MLTEKEPIQKIKPTPFSEICLVRVDDIDESHIDVLQKIDKNRYDAIAHPEKKKEFLASRVALNELCKDLDIIYDGRRPLLRFGGHLSISHAHHFAGVYYSAQHRVGLDIEAYRPTLERIDHKFLNVSEVLFTKESHRQQKLQIMWSAKEALYKLHGKKGLSLKENIYIHPFEIGAEGMTIGEIKYDDTFISAQVFFKIIEDAFIVWTVKV